MTFEPVPNRQWSATSCPATCAWVEVSRAVAAGCVYPPLVVSTTRQLVAVGHRHQGRCRPGSSSMERASRCAGRSLAWPRPPVRTESSRPTPGALQCLGARVPGDQAVQDARVAFDLQRARRNSAVHGEDQLGCRTSSRGFSRLRRRLGGREPVEPSPLWRQVQSPGPSLRGVVVQDRGRVWPGRGRGVAGHAPIAAGSRG